LIGVLNLIYVAKLDSPHKLAGVGMGNMLMNMIANSMSYGFNSALDTLVSQAVGARNLEQCGVYLNRARLVLIFLFVISTIILLNIEWILNAFGQDKDVSSFAYEYILVCLPGILV
jgi:Na+-driven multidrug efflux pump